MPRFGRVVGSLFQTGIAGGAYGRGAVVGSLGLFSPTRSMKGVMRNIGSVAKGFKANNPRDAAMASMKLLGTAAGVTYVSRVISGRGAFRDRKGKRDILPYIPFV